MGEQIVAMNPAQKFIAKKMKESNLISYVFTSDNKEEVKNESSAGSHLF